MVGFLHAGAVQPGLVSADINKYFAFYRRMIWSVITISKRIHAVILHFGDACRSQNVTSPLTSKSALTNNLAFVIDRIGRSQSPSGMPWQQIVHVFRLVVLVEEAVHLFHKRRA